MRKALKWIGIVLGGLLLLLVVIGVGLSNAGASRLSRTYEVEAETITIPTDAAALERGEHLVNVACRDCHAPDLSGQLLVEQPPIFTIHSANITGLADTHSDEDLILAIRHGVRRDRRPLLIMPAEEFIHLSKEDLGAIIAYMKTIPRIGEARPEPQLQPVGRLLAGAGVFDSSIPASYIDHDMPFPDMPQVGDSLDYGQYLTGFCQSCHGADLAGGTTPIPNSPPAPNLTPGGELIGWTESDFITAIRSGVTPSGRQLDPEFMPWPSFAKFEDDELRALWLYLESLPPRETPTE